MHTATMWGYISGGTLTAANVSLVYEPVGWERGGTSDKTLGAVARNNMIAFNVLPPQ